MKDMNSAAHPRDLANAAETIVEGLPHSILAMLLQASLPEQDGAKDPVSGRTSSHRTTIRRATEYLNSEFEPAFAAVIETLSEPLHQSWTELSTALQSLSMDLPKPGLASDPAVLAQLARTTDEVIAPAVGTFLGALFDQVTAFEGSKTQREHDIDSSSLDEIELIARKINFIAINASVEAARVGDVGKGFAVIAAEIKELSVKAKESVVRIRSELT